MDRLEEAEEEIFMAATEWERTYWDLSLATRDVPELSKAYRDAEMRLRTAVGDWRRLRGIGRV